ncbi:DUF2269 family protein [Streptomyces cavernae]|uniref:DUF2269 family protein n=1 Tax=Streptomyces cavernae TaxID=2259034 RepID=UPI000FEB9339|nr:DUF2269 family protein [Streptomyces cavernae]
MTKFLLAVHVLAAIVAIGPVTVAASMFPPAARKALQTPDDPQALSTLRLLHRICRVYATMGVAVPVFGLATAKNMGVLGDAWLITSIVLTALAAGILAVLVLPRQEALLEELEEWEADANQPRGSSSAAPGDAGPAPGAAGRALDETTVTSAVLVEGPQRQRTVQLAMFTGVFNLLWATVTVLMIVRPGSTTGA